jgi:arylsulfatase A-like enzyme
MLYRFLPILLISNAFMLLPESGNICSAQSSRPNIILILADDMGYSDIGCFGSEIKTPNLDRLATQGVRFTQFYNASRCCPTRASLLTGLYQHQAGVGDMVADLGFPSYQGYLNNQCVTLGEVLKLNGYSTYMSGKWHVGSRAETLPRRRGFERYFGLIDGAGSYFQRIPYRNNQPAPRWMLDDKDFYPSDSTFYMTDAITDYALSFIKDEAADKKPFFLYMAFTAPHWPLHALPADIAKYRGKYSRGWNLLRQERYQRMLELGIIDSSAKLSPADRSSPDWESLSSEEKSQWDLRMAVYAAMIDRMDQNIGKLIDNLRRTGELKNTLIIFLSDNGGCHENTKTQKNYLNTRGEIGSPDSFEAIEIPWANVCNTPFRMYKHWEYEGGIATPFIAYYPQKIRGNMLVSFPGHIIDLMPTILEISNSKYPEIYNDNKIQKMEGISLLPVIDGKDLKRANPIYWEHEGNRAIREGDWKLVSAYDNIAKRFKSWELYNLKNDRSELEDLSQKEPEMVNELIEKYNNWATKVGVISRESLDKKK